MNLRKWLKKKDQVVPYGYPAWVRVTHWTSFFFLTLVARSGLGILGVHPKLYWKEDSLPPEAWARFTRRKMPKDELFCSSDEEEAWSSWVALPGGKNLGLARYWHYLGSIGWVATGVYYVTRMVVTKQRWRLIPHTKRFFTDVGVVMKQYLRLEKPRPGLPGINPLHPLNALQELVYFGVVFILSPLAILTGLAQSPAILSWLPRPLKRLEDKQFARSVHFLTLVAFGGFLVVHVAMVTWHGFTKEMNKIVLGKPTKRTNEGALIGVGVLGGTALFHVLANALSQKTPRATQRGLSIFVDPLIKRVFRRLTSKNVYPESKISPYFRVNGYPPISAYPEAKGDDDTFERLLADEFRDYRLEVKGLVKSPLQLSLADLRAMPRQEQTTLHVCIQGWSSVGKWAGAPLAEILRRCGPLPDARYVVFRSFGLHEQSGKPYYECISLEDAYNEQGILAYELNDETLPLQHGAPVRVRLEKRLGFKMVKYLRSIEFVRDYREIGEGMGGVREDQQHYDMEAYL